VLAILGSFSPGNTELSLAEISRRTGLASSTTHRLVAELSAWGALERDDKLRYHIGPRLRELGRSGQQPLEGFVRGDEGKEDAPANAMGKA
jgi:DNA-binding IclR family transcriptional regulator